MRENNEVILDGMKNGMQRDISGLLDPDAIISSVEGVLGHKMGDKHKAFVNNFLETHTSVEDYLKILNKNKKVL